MQEMRRIYLDHNATTPLDPRVRDAMLDVMSGGHGNPSSVHAFGQAAGARVEEARDRVAALIGARPPELVFTASGTEANNAVIFSQARLAGWHGCPDCKTTKPPRCNSRIYIYIYIYTRRSVGG